MPSKQPISPPALAAGPGGGYRFPGMSPYAQWIVDVVYPPQCRCCGGFAEVDADQVCPDCRRRLFQQITHPYCPRCGSEVASFEMDAGRCHECRTRTLRIRKTARLGPYAASLQTMLRAYKFHERDCLEPLLGRWFAAAIQAHGWLDRIDAVTVVPTHWRRHITKTLYPARALAVRTASLLDLPFVDLLRRLRSGPHQIGLSYSARLTNVRGVFAPRHGVVLNKARLLIIDDVRTTGATLEECARVLLAAGAAEVYAAVICKAEWQHQSGGPITVS